MIFTIPNNSQNTMREVRSAKCENKLFTALICSTMLLFANTTELKAQNGNANPNPNAGGTNWLPNNGNVGVEFLPLSGQKS